MVNGVESEPTSVLSGIPQGTVLGPLLFVVYINDILDKVKSHGLLFADDAKIHRAITKKEGAKSLQDDLRELEKWSDKWLLKFHLDNCHVLTLGKFDNIKLIDSELTFSEHISSKVKKANTIVGLIRRSFTSLDCKSFTKIYTAFVRPHLEYAQSVWSPHLQKYVNMLENVQIRATKLVDGLENLDYEERLKRLNLPSLAFRRFRGDLIELYKHFHHYDQDTISPSFQRRERVTRKHEYQLLQRKTKDAIRGVQSNSFYYCRIKAWDVLVGG